MNVVNCVIRTKKKFLEENIFSYYNDNPENKGNKKFNNEIIPLWNSVFNMSYFQYKKLLYDITKKNIDKVGFNKVYHTLDDFKEIFKNDKKGDNVIFIFVDGDDFIDDNFITKVEPYLNSEVKMYRWDYTRFAHGNKTLVHCKGNSDFERYPVDIETNNSMIKYHVNMNDLIGHRPADYYWKSLLNINKVHIDLSLTLDNKNIGSIYNQLSLGELHTGEGMVNYITRAISNHDFLAERVSPVFSPYVAEVNQANQALYDSIL